MRNLVERVRYTTTYLQQVMEVTHQLSQGDYEHTRGLLQDAAGTEAEIQELIGTSIQMVREVRTREDTLRRALDGART